MKPDWKDAPEWANWLAMDQDGCWAWFEGQPHDRYSMWVERGGRVESVLCAEWRESLEQRP